MKIVTTKINKDVQIPLSIGGGGGGGLRTGILGVSIMHLPTTVAGISVKLPKLTMAPFKVASPMQPENWGEIARAASSFEETPPKNKLPCNKRIGFGISSEL